MAWNKDSAKAKAWREARDARVQQLTEEFEQRTLALRQTSEWRRLLTYFVSFHDYSFKNTMLIQMQCPGARWVAGYRAWVNRGRQVRKGEKGILIVMPAGMVPVKDKDGNEVLDKNGEPRMRQAFKMGSVFDYSQTDPIPGADKLSTLMNQVAVPLDGDSGADVIRRLTTWLNKSGWTVNVAPMSGHGAVNATRHVVSLNAGDSIAMRALTLLHESARVALTTLGDEHHVNYERNAGIAETEAASVAFVLGGMMGLDTTSFTIGYASGWALLDGVSLKRVAEHVQKAVKLMADAILEANASGVELEGAHLQLGHAA